jgi:protein SCO1
MRALARTLLLLLVAVAAGCGGSAPRFQLTDVTGADFGKELNLTDHRGEPRTLEHFRGKVVVVFFGFAQCPDVCPTTLQDLSLVVRELGTDGERVQVLFVTVDPERDTREVLAQYVPAFHPSFLGLHGDADATARAAKSFKVYYQKQPQPGGSYTVDHAAGTYILDREGRLRLFAHHGAGPRALLHDIRLLVR